MREQTFSTIEYRQIKRRCDNVVFCMHCKCVATSTMWHNIFNKEPIDCCDDPFYLHMNESYH